jgi:type IV pilus assembly protein PilA
VTERDDAFTLTELMVVVLVVAVLLAIAIPTFLGSKATAQDRRTQANLRSALSAAVATNSAVTATASTLAANEASLSFVAAPAASTSSSTVSVLADGTRWAAAARSSTGVCWAVRSDASGQVTYGGSRATPSCDGALAASIATLDVFAVVGTLPAQVLSTAGLVGYWRLGETSGTTALDSSGNGNNGTYAGTPTRGQPSLSSDSSDPSVVFAPNSWVDLPSLGMRSDYSINALIRLPNNGGLAKPIISTPSFGLAVTVSGDPAYFPNWGPSVSCNGAMWGGWQVPGTVVMVTLIHSSTQCGLNVDGVSVWSSPPPVIRPEDFTVARLGAALDGTGAQNHQVDEVAIWNRALTPSEIAALQAAR